MEPPAATPPTRCATRRLIPVVVVAVVALVSLFSSVVTIRRAQQAPFVETTNLQHTDNARDAVAVASRSDAAIGGGRGNAPKPRIHRMRLANGTILDENFFGNAAGAQRQDVPNSNGVTASSTSPSTPTPTPTATEVRKTDIRPICIQNFYGSNCNRMITLAKALTMARQRSTIVKLDVKWTNWYIQYFDQREDVMLTYDDALANYTFKGGTAVHSSNDRIKCLQTRQAKDIYRLTRPIPASIHRGAYIPMLDQLLPKRAIQKEAELAVPRLYSQPAVDDAMATTETATKTETAPGNYFTADRLFFPYVSVHRRWLEGGCYRSASKSKLHSDGCTQQVIRQTCDFNYDFIKTKLQNTATNNSTTTTTTTTTADNDDSAALKPIVLYTDGQNATFDDTFPIHDTNDFMIQLWMMTLSEHHFGNPISTVDIVVRHWRHYRIQQSSDASTTDQFHPMGCFPPWNVDDGRGA